MATYECSKCGMSVNATCGKCDSPLANDFLKVGDKLQLKADFMGAQSYKVTNE